MEDAFAAVQMLNELRDPAGVFEIQPFGLTRLWIRQALVGQRDFQAFVEEGKLAQALGQRVKVVLGRGENFLVWKKMYFGAALFGGAGFLELGLRIAFRVALLPDVAVAPDFQIELVT